MLAIAWARFENEIGWFPQFISRLKYPACFSQERMGYIPAEDSDDNTAKVVYTSCNSNVIFQALKR